MEPSHSIADLSDEELIRIYCFGEARSPAAIEAIVTRYWKALFAFFRRRGSDPDAAADLVSQTWIRVMETCSSFKPAKAKFRTWLFIVAKNLQIDEWRKRKRYVLETDLKDADDGGSPLENEPSWGPDPFEQFNAAEIFEHLRECLEILTPQQRSIIELYFNFELEVDSNETFRELALNFRISRNAISGRYYTALRKLKACVLAKLNR